MAGKKKQDKKSKILAALATVKKEHQFWDILKKPKIPIPHDIRLKKGGASETIWDSEEFHKNLEIFAQMTSAIPEILFKKNK
jgi:hypothetical protein